MRKVLSKLMVIAVFLLYSGCEDFVDCESQDDIRLKIGFYQVRDGIVIPDTIYDATLLTLTSINDTLFTDRDFYSLGLPLNPASDTTVYILSREESNDTLFIFYDRKINLVSPKCGGVIYFELNGFFSNFKDSIVNPDVKIETDENIRIFL